MSLFLIATMQLWGNNMRETGVFDPTTIIKEQPAGIIHDSMIRYDTYYFNFYSSFLDEMMPHQNTAVVGHYIEGDDGYVYLADPIGFVTDTYLKLEKISDDTLVAHTPQAIYNLEDQTYYAVRMTTVYDENSGRYKYVIDWNNLDMKYLLRNDTLTQISDGTQETEGGIYEKSILAMADEDGNFYCFGNAGLSMSPCTDKAYKLPEDADVKEMMFTYSITNDASATTKKIKFVQNGNDIYLNDPYSGNNDIWIKGTIDGEKAIFKQQYVGIYEYDDDMLAQHVYFRPYSDGSIKYDDYGNVVYDYSFSDELILNYNKEENRFTSIDSCGFLLNIGPTGINPVYAYHMPVIFEYKEVPAVPMTPEIVFFGQYSDNVMCGMITVKVPACDIYGEYINPEKLSYVIYFDSDEPYTFTPEKYMYLEKEMTEIPYSYSDDYDFYSNGDKKDIYFYSPINERFGIQSIFKGGGEERKSDICWYNVNTTDIKDVSKYDHDVVVQRYNIGGQRINEPVKGINIIKTADGRTIKVLHK